MSEFIGKLRRSWRSYLLWGIFWALLVVPLTLSMIFVTLSEGKANKKYVPELRKIADQTPLYPDFQKIGDDYIVLKNGKASLQRSFKTDARFADIRSFYDSALAKDNWGPPEVPPPSIFVGEQYYVTYHRGAYEIGIYRGDGRQDVYEISFVRHSK